jgi:hypothetical protein
LQDKRKDAVKKVIAAMTVGKDVSSLFTDVVNCMQTEKVCPYIKRSVINTDRKIKTFQSNTEIIDHRYFPIKKIYIHWSLL